MPKKLWIVLLSLVVLCLVLLFWLRPQDDARDVTASSSSTASDALPATAVQTLATANTVQSQSQQDTEINCQLRLDAKQALSINEKTRHCFEYFIGQYGEKTLTVIRQDFIRYIEAAYPLPAQGQIIDLWERYLNYRQALAQIKAPQGEENAAYYRAIFSATQKLRQQFFSAHEAKALFGQEDIYHDYTLQRLNILENKTLSETQKAQALHALFAALPTDWQANLQQLTQLEDLRQLSTALKARGGSAAELHDLRVNLVGPEAATRLEQLDQEREQWKSQVQLYLAARDDILHSSQSDQAKQQAIVQLRRQHFPETNQQLRLETFETVHDQGGELPFAP